MSGDTAQAAGARGDLPVPARAVLPEPLCCRGDRGDVELMAWA